MIAVGWKTALRCVPLLLLGVVLWRVKPWTVPLAASAPWAIAASILVNLLFFVPIKAARWRVALADPPPYRQVLAAMLEGLLASTAIGFGSGDLVRAARLRAHQDRAEGQLAVDYARTWAERGAEAFALALLVFVAGLITTLGAWALAASGAAAGAYVTLLCAGRFFAPHLARWPRLQRALLAGLQASTPRRVAAMTALSLLGWGTEIVMLVLFQGAFHLDASFGTALLVLVAINAAIAIPSVPGHFGTFEAGATAALVLSGVPRDTAVAFAFSYHLGHVIPIALVATAVFLYRTRRYNTTPARTST